MHQQHGGANLAAVLQDWHIQEGKRRCHVPAVVGVQTAGMAASRRFVVGVVVLHELRRVLRQRINYATRQRIGTVFIVLGALRVQCFSLFKAYLLRILSIKISVSSYTGHVVFTPTALLFSLTIGLSSNLCTPLLPLQWHYGFFVLHSGCLPHSKVPI